MSNPPETSPSTNTDQQKAQEPDEDLSFEELGLDPRLIRALTKKSIDKPTPIQRVAIPLILEGKDVVARAKTGSGKTFAYLLPLLHKLFSDSASSKNSAPTAFILVPTRELCQQVYTEVLSLIELCRVQLKVVQLTGTPSATAMKTVLAGPPDILVSTPTCVQTCLSSGVLQAKSVQDSLSILILDEADLLLAYGYEKHLRDLKVNIPRRCQCLLMSATSSDDVEKLKKFILHNPYILTLPEAGDSKDEFVPKNVQQFWIQCSSRDKLVHILALLKLDLVLKKVLIFTNTIDMSFRLKLFLEQFGIKSAVLNAELPQNSRLHILEGFNAGLFDYLIATDDSDSKEKEPADGENHVEQKKSKKRTKQNLDSEFGVVRGIDFKNVHTGLQFCIFLNLFPNMMGLKIKKGIPVVQGIQDSTRQNLIPQTSRALLYLLFDLGGQSNFVWSANYFHHPAKHDLLFQQVINFEMPPTAAGYVHRIGRTGRAYNTGQSVSLVSPEEMEIFEDIKSFLGEDESTDSTFIAQFPLLEKNAVENLRYRAEDVARSVTKIAVREARAQDLRNEILNSEKLKAHFQENPKDLDLLKHDRVLSKKSPALHLRDVPEYLLDPTTQQASNIIKLSRAAMGRNTNAARHKGKSKRNRDPLKALSAEGSKGGMKRKGKERLAAVKTKGSKLHDGLYASQLAQSWG